MDSILTVTQAASDRSLLGIAELREAVGTQDSSQDEQLLRLGNRVSAAITAACGISRAGAIPATMRLETLSQDYRLSVNSGVLILARCPVTQIVSVTENGTELDAADYVLDATAGLLRRLCGGEPARWPCGRITVVFAAGWATVPEDLKLAAQKLAQAIWAESRRGDPSLKRVEIPGLMTREYWVAPSSDPLLPADVMDILTAGGYIQKIIG